MFVAGVDVGFRGTGVVIVQQGTERTQIIHAQAIRTERGMGGDKVTDDEAARCRFLARHLHDLLKDRGVSAVIAEMPTGGAQSAIAIKQMALAKATVCAVTEILQLPLVAVTPQAVKRLAGSKSATKEDVEKHVLGFVEWACTLPKIKAEREHITDAAAAYLAGWHSDIIRALRR